MKAKYKLILGRRKNYPLNIELEVYKGADYLKNIDGWMTNLGNVKGLEKRADFAKPIHFEF